MKYVVDFEAWALEKYRQFRKVQESDSNFVAVPSPATRTVTIINLKNGKTSFSKCHNCDKFNVYVGYGVAWAKYIGEEIPKQATPVKISELTPGQKFVFDEFIFATEAKEKAEFYYIGHNPVNNASIAVRVDSGECYQFSMNRHVMKI